MDCFGIKELFYYRFKSGKKLKDIGEILFMSENAKHVANFIIVYFF